MAPLVVFLLSDRARHITGQVYSAVGKKIAVWNQPGELRAMFAADRWTPEEIEARIDGQLGQARMPILDRLEEIIRRAGSGDSD